MERFSELQQCYRQTNLCFSRRYSVERNQILEEETPGETAAEVLEDVKLGELNISSLSQRQAEAFLYTGTREEVSGFVEDYFAQLGDGNVDVYKRQGIMFDREVVETLLKYVPLYPKGTMVTLSDGREAIIYENFGVHNLRPVVRLMDGELLDLSNEANYHITLRMKTESGFSTEEAEKERNEMRCV